MRETRRTDCTRPVKPRFDVGTAGMARSRLTSVVHAEKRPSRAINKKRPQNPHRELRPVAEKRCLRMFHLVAKNSRAGINYTVETLSLLIDCATL